MGRCLPVVAGREREGGPHGEVGDFSIPRRENGDAGLVLATLPCPLAACMPDEGEGEGEGEGDEAGAPPLLAWQRGDQIETPGNEGRLRSCDGGACSDRVPRK